MYKPAYANGYAAYPAASSAGPALHFEPHKYEPRAHHKSRRRRHLLTRIALFASVALFIAFLVSPSLRATLLPALSFGLLSGVEQFQLETVRYYDLNNVQGTSRGWEREERILLCAPLRDAAPHLPMFFSHLRNLTYPHNLIDLAFLVGDSADDTVELLSTMLSELQEDEDPKKRFGELSILEKDFGQTVNQDVESRHGFAAQASRRKSMAQARNWLLSAALRPTHSWVYWRDVDVEMAPFTILEDLMRHNKDVIVPNVWRPLPEWLGGEQPYDLNSWQESETGLALAETLDEDAVIVEGYAEYATWRPHLAYLRDPYGDPDMEMDIDGVGGVSILAKAKVFRSGVHFPAFSFQRHAETEGFGKMAKRMDYSVVGLPHYTIWHLYEPSVDDIRHMEELENERRLKEEEIKYAEERRARIQEQFDNPEAQWENDLENLDQLAEEEASKESKDDDVKEDGSKSKGKDKSGKKGEKAETDEKDAKDTKNEKSKESKDGKDAARDEEASEKGSQEKPKGDKDDKSKKVIQHDSDHRNIKPKEGQIINDHGHIRVIKVPDSDNVVGETTEYGDDDESSS